VDGREQNKARGWERGLLCALVIFAFLATCPAAFAGEITTTGVPLRMSDGVRLMANEYVPSSGCPCPVVVNFNPYTNATAEGAGYGVSTLPASYRDYLVSRGYAVVIVDVRGTGQSEGTFGMFNSREQRDYGEVIQLAAQEPFSDGKVAVVGDSYGGIAAVLAAEQPGVGPPNGPLRAIVPAVPMGDAYRDIGFAGGAPNDGFLTLWGGIVGAPTTVAPLLDAQSDPQIALNASSSRVSDWQQLVGGFVGFNSGQAGSAGDPQMLAGASSYDGAWYRLRSPLTNVGAVRVPTFIIGTSFDIFQRTEPILFNALSLPAGEKKLYMDNTYHGVVGSDSSSPPGQGTNEVYDDHGQLVPNVSTVMTADWLDRWVKGVSNGADQWPTVLRRYLVPGSASGGLFVREHQDPPTGLQYHPWYLATGSALSPVQPRTSGSAQTVFDPGTGVCSRNTIQYLFGVVPDNECSTDSRSNEVDGITFTSAPLTQPVAITGPSALRVWFSSTRPDTNVVALLSAVAPDGSAQQFTFGSLIASFRALDRHPCPSGGIVLDCSVLDASGSIIQPWHPFTRDSVRKLQPGRIYQAMIEINPPAIELPAGYRLRLTLKTGNFPQTLPNLTSLADAAGGITTLYFGAKRPSDLYLGDVAGGLDALRQEYDSSTGG
jgi:putative CocE/NonD family hydrolase